MMKRICDKLVISVLNSLTVSTEFAIDLSIKSCVYFAFVDCIDTKMDF